MVTSFSEEENSKILRNGLRKKAGFICTVNNHAYPDAAYQCENEFCNVKPLICSNCALISYKYRAIKLCRLCRVTESMKHIDDLDDDLVQQSIKEKETVKCIPSVDKFWLDFHKIEKTENRFGVKNIRKDQLVTSRNY